MFSVLRFSGIADLSIMEVLGSRVNELIPGMYTGPDRVPERFSCPISEDDDWGLQCSSIRDVVRTLAPLIREVRTCNVDVEVDVAIHPDDCKRWLTELALDKALLQVLSENSVTIMFSLYGRTTDYSRAHIEQGPSGDS